jgi:cytochrome c5
MNPQDTDKPHPIKVALVVIAGSAAVIVAIVLIASFAVGSYENRSLQGDPAMTDAAVAKRLQPVSQLALGAPGEQGAPAQAATPQTAAPATAPAAAAPAAPAAGAKADAGKGKAVYDSTCQVCHAAGVAGAPKFGDKAMWGPRIAQGAPTLYEHALKGKGAMPPKGGNTTLGDDDVKAAVDYMVSQAK